MDESAKEEQKKLDDFLENIELLSDEEIDNLNFYEACLYLEKLNFIDNLTSKKENKDE